MHDHWRRIAEQEEVTIATLRKRLGQASGALDDIKVLITSCTPIDSDGRIYASVLRRILSSADQVRKPPGWYRHDWEKNEWEAYISGKTRACSVPEKACKEYARELQDYSAHVNVANVP